MNGSLLFETTIYPSFAAKFKSDTLRVYRSVIDDFMAYCGKSFENCDETDAYNYNKYLSALVYAEPTKLFSNGKKNKLSRSTYAARISTLKSLSAFINSRSFIAGYENIFEKIFVCAVPEELEISDLPILEDLELLFESASDCPRDFIIFALAAKCGLTTSQICNLNVEDICAVDDSTALALNIRQGKNNYYIELTEDLVECVSSYINVTVTAGPLFLTTRGTRMTPRTLQRLLKKYLECISADINGREFTFQDMRHCAIAYMKNGGASDDEIAASIGIHTPGKIARYEKVSSDQLVTATRYSVLSVKSQ